MYVGVATVEQNIKNIHHQTVTFKVTVRIIWYVPHKKNNKKIILIDLPDQQLTKLVIPSLIKLLSISTKRRTIICQSSLTFLPPIAPIPSTQITKRTNQFLITHDHSLSISKSSPTFISRSVHISLLKPKALPPFRIALDPDTRTNFRSTLE